jgi:phytoene synthase
VPLRRGADHRSTTTTLATASTPSTRARRALAAAGIHDADLQAAYEACRRLNAAHGRTYYLATLLLPPPKRPYVHALYGFARYADELVDDLDAPDPDRLVRWSEATLQALQRGEAVDPRREPVMAALADTLRRWDIPLAHVEAFLTSMQMDIDVTTYPTYADLERYMYGSAAVIGLQMVPILEPVPGREEEAYVRAQALGEAFQLSNFLRDVAEDLDRGRVYLPLEDLDRFGVAVDVLMERRLTPGIRDLLAFEIERTRALYAVAAGGVALLDPTSRPCIRTAITLYGGILEEIERAGYDVFAGRVAVPLPHRLRVAGAQWAAALRERRVARSWHALPAERSAAAG